MPPARGDRWRWRAASGQGEKGFWIAYTSAADGFPFDTNGAVKLGAPILVISLAVKLGKQLAER